MADLVRLIQHIPKAVLAVEDTDLSWIEKAAMFRLAAEACQQAQIMDEIAAAIARGRK